LFKPQQ
jgi:hypothetical protein